MTTAELIDAIEHPIYPLIDVPPHDLTHVIKGNNGYRWVRSQEALDAPCGPWVRKGTNLYNWKTGESLGAVVDVDGGSHGGGLTPDQIGEIRLVVVGRGYVALVTTSTSGTGLHIFILWTAPVQCSPEEHRQLGKRAALMLERDAGLPYRWIDVSGNILWTAAKDAGPGAFQGTPTAGRLDPSTLPELPPVPGKQGDAPAELCEPLKLLMGQAKEMPYVIRWVQEIGAVHLHKELLSKLQKNYPGNFISDSGCTDPTTPNAWVRRNDAGYFDVWGWGRESTWDETPSGYWHTTFGKAPEFSEANKAGTPESNNSYVYSTPQPAVDAVRQLTGKLIDIPDTLKIGERRFSVVNKSGVIQLRASKCLPNEPTPEGWHNTKGYFWTGAESPDGVSEETVTKVKGQFFQTKQDRKLTGLYRYTGEGVPVVHSREQALSVARNKIGEKSLQMIDRVTANPVELVCEAFAPVIQSGKLNVGPQFTVKPQKERCDTWLRMLIRLGSSLTPALIDPQALWAEWVRRHRMMSGGRWLLWWVAYLCQRPTQRLPIVAFVGKPDDGKSTFGDALELLWDKSGTSDAGELLRTRSQFTGSVAQSVLGRIEDCDISKRDQLLRLTPWVTSPQLMAEHKHQTPFAVPNQLHLLVTTNNPDDIPIRDQDCRFVVIQTEPLGSDKDVEFANKLDRERAAFLDLVLGIKLPSGSDRYGRLALPDVVTDQKADAAESNRTTVEVFAEECLTTEGATDSDFVSNGDLYERYKEWTNANGRPRDCDSAQSLTKSLGAWFTLRGVQVARTNSQRGRKGIKVRP